MVKIWLYPKISEIVLTRRLTNFDSGLTELAGAFVLREYRPVKRTYRLSNYADICKTKHEIFCSTPFPMKPKHWLEFALVCLLMSE